MHRVLPEIGGTDRTDQEEFAGRIAVELPGAGTIISTGPGRSRGAGVADGLSATCVSDAGKGEDSGSGGVAAPATGAGTRAARDQACRLSQAFQSPKLKEEE